MAVNDHSMACSTLSSLSPHLRRLEFPFSTFASAGVLFLRTWVLSWHMRMAVVIAVTFIRLSAHAPIPDAILALGTLEDSVSLPPHSQFVVRPFQSFCYARRATW